MTSDTSQITATTATTTNVSVIAACRRSLSGACRSFSKYESTFLFYNAKSTARTGTTSCRKVPLLSLSGLPGNSSGKPQKNMITNICTLVLLGS